MTSIPRSTYPGARVLLAAGAILTAALITQCQMVTDSVTGPRANAQIAGNCISDCNTSASEATRQENQLHQDNLKACDKNKTCKAAENERHDAAIDAIQAQREACLAGCHHQGGGQGRPK